MKKIAAILLAITLAFGFTACGAGEKEKDDGNKPESEITCTVTFDSDGGTEVKSVTVKKGEKLSEPEPPAKTTLSRQYEFIGWYNGEKEWRFDTDAVNENLELKAKWKIKDDFTIGFKPEK